MENLIERYERTKEMSIKYISVIVSTSIIRAIYALFTLLPINREKITFASSRSNELSGNLYYIARELKSRELDLTFIFLLEKYKSGFLNKVVYILRMLRATYHLATSEYFFIDDYYYPVYLIKPRSGVTIIQLWHAAGAFKRFGYSTIDKDFGPSKTYLKFVKIHSNYTYAIVSSKNVVKHYAEAFDMPEDQVLPLGLPRADYFFDKAAQEAFKEKFYNFYPELKEKRIILYAPTYRGKSYRKKSFQSHIDFSILEEKLGKEYAILVHLHPYITNGLVETYSKNFVYETNQLFKINELMTISDLLITDYSSVIFEYSILQRPILFFTPDLEQYKKERDFYFDFDTFIPGPRFNNTKDLAYFIGNSKFNLDKVANFSKVFFENVGGTNSKRIVDYLLKLK